MPNSLYSTDAAFPDLNGKNQKEQISIITNYLFMLLEQLRYILANLGIDNFNSSELEGMRKLFTGDIQIQVSDMNGNISTLYQSVDKISSQVEDVMGNYSNLTQEVDQISSTVSDISGEFSQVKQDVDGLQITTSGGVTYISGNHVKSGVLEGSTIKCVLNNSQGQSNGELQFFYQGNLVGRVQMDTYGDQDGTGSETKNRVFFESLENFAMKLISDTNMSLTTKDGSIYINSAGGRVNIYGKEDPVIRSSGNVSYTFKDDGIYLNNRKITN